MTITRKYKKNGVWVKEHGLTINPITGVLKRPISTIGDELHRVIKEQTGETPCSECVDEINKLNAMTVQQVMNEINTISVRIVDRAKKKAQKWYQRAAANFLPSLVSCVVKDWIAEACSRSQK